MDARCRSQVLARNYGPPLHGRVARLVASQDKKFSCGFIALAAGCCANSAMGLAMSNIRAVFSTAEALWERVSGELTDPKEVAQYYPDAHFLGTFEALVAPPASVPPLLQQCLPDRVMSPADAVLEALELLGRSSGFIAATASGHTVLLQPGRRNEDGQCLELSLINGLGHQRRRAGSSSTAGSSGYMLRFEGKDLPSFKRSLAEGLGWQYFDRYEGVDGWPNQTKADVAYKQLGLQLDVFKSGRTMHAAIRDAACNAACSCVRLALRGEDQAGASNRPLCMTCQSLACSFPGRGDRRVGAAGGRAAAGAAATAAAAATGHCSVFSAGVAAYHQRAQLAGPQCKVLDSSEGQVTSCSSATAAHKAACASFG